MANLNPNIYIEDKALYDYAASSARLMQPVGMGSASQATAALKSAMLSLRRSHSAVEKRCAAMADAPSACRWLLDNMYLAKREYISAFSSFQQAGKLSGDLNFSVLQPII